MRQFFMVNNLFKNIYHCKQICALIFHITNNFLNQLIFFKQNLQLTNKINFYNVFASNRPIVTCFYPNPMFKKIHKGKSIKCTFVHPKVKCWCDKNYDSDIRENKLFKCAYHHIK